MDTFKIVIGYFCMAMIMKNSVFFGCLLLLSCHTQLLEIKVKTDELKAVSTQKEGHSKHYMIFLNGNITDTNKLYIRFYQLSILLT
jgi:hypothetical protein